MSTSAVPPATAPPGTTPGTPLTAPPPATAPATPVTAPPPVAAAPPVTALPRVRRDRRLRWRGVAIFIFGIAEFLIGNELAVAGSPYPLIWLILHVLVALGLVIGAGGTIWIALRLRSGTNLAIGTLTFLFALGATISGTVFLFAGQNNGALYAMELLGGLTILGGLLLIIFGSVPARLGARL